MSPDAVSDAAVIRRYRRALIPMIAAALPLTLAGWLALYWLPPPLAGTENPGSRLLYALGWSCVAILLAFVTGIEAVAHRRLFSRAIDRSEEHTSELQSLMRISYAVFCLKK